MTSNVTRHLLVAALILFLAGIGGTGCSWLDRDPEITGPVIDDFRLNDDLADFEQFAALAIREGANDIQSRTRDRVAKRAAVQWKAQSIDAFQSAMNEGTPREQLVEAWILAVQMEEFFGLGAGRGLFGDEQPRAANASGAIRARIEDIAKSHLPESDFTILRDQIAEVAKNRPWTSISNLSATEGALRTQAGSQALGIVTAIGSAPITAVTGIGTGAAGFASIPGAAADINRTIEDFPEELRWQGELLYTDIENSDTVTSLVLATDVVAASADRVARAADELPQDIQHILDNTLETIRRDQTEYRETLRLVQGTASDARATAENTRAAIVEAQELSQSLDQTAKTINETLAAYAALTEKDPDAPPPENPVTVEDIAAMARDIGDAATELRLTMGELGAMVDDGRLAAAAEQAATAATRAAVEQSAPLLEQSDERARGIIDHAFKRGLQLLVGLLVVLVLWEIVRWGLNRGRSKHRNPES